MGFQIDRIVLRQIRMPLVHFFETSFGRTYERHIVLVEVVSRRPFRLGRSHRRRESFLQRRVDRIGVADRARLRRAARAEASSSTSAAEVADRTAHIRGHHMARGGVEAAVWDLRSAAQRRSALANRSAAARAREIPCGVSIGIQDSVPQLIKKIETEARRRLSAHQDEDQAGLGCRRDPRSARALSRRSG